MLLFPAIIKSSIDIPCRKIEAASSGVIVALSPSKILVGRM